MDPSTHESVRPGIVSPPGGTEVSAPPGPGSFPTLPFGCSWLIVTKKDLGARGTLV